MLRAYFDESGTHKKSDLVMVAGLVGLGSQFEALESVWVELLDNYELGYYHATECESRDGIFSRLERPLREDITRNLATLIARHRLVPVGAAVSRSEWETNSHRKSIIEYKDPYFFCYEACLYHIDRLSMKGGAREKIPLIFSKQQEYEGAALGRYETWKRNSHYSNGIGSITFADPRELIPLQAADLVAYELFRAWLTRAKGLEWASRPAMKALIDAGVPILGGYYPIAEVDDIWAELRRFQLTSVPLSKTPVPIMISYSFDLSVSSSRAK